MIKGKDILGRLIGSPNRVKLLRTFVLNPEMSVDTKSLSKRIKISMPMLNKELALLKSVGLVREIKVVNQIEKTKQNKKKNKKKTVTRSSKGYTLNLAFPYNQSLRMLLNADLLYQQKNLATYFKKCGDIRFLAVAGVFLQDNNSRVDMIIVGNNLKRSLVDSYIKNLESEIGKELDYAVLETADFDYRINSGDKFVRDLLDYPHERIVDKIGL